MPQLSLYVDKDTLKKIKTGAKISEVSESKFVTAILNEHFSNEWPEGYQNLFGALKEEPLIVPNELDFDNDGKREVL